MQAVVDPSSVSHDGTVGDHGDDECGTRAGKSVAFDLPLIDDGDNDGNGDGTPEAEENSNGADASADTPVADRGVERKEEEGVVQFQITSVGVKITSERESYL